VLRNAFDRLLDIDESVPVETWLSKESFVWNVEGGKAIASMVMDPDRNSLKFQIGWMLPPESTRSPSTQTSSSFGSDWWNTRDA
jgi:hypothetical protein